MAIYYANGGNSNQARVVKVHRAVYNSTFTLSGNTTSNIFNNTISPATSGNWFYIHWRVAMSHSTNNSNFIQMLIDGNMHCCRSGADTDNGSASASHYNESYGNSHLFNASYWMYTGHYTYVHSSSSNFQFILRANLQGGTAYCNHSYSYDDEQRGYPSCEWTMQEMEGS